MSEIGSKIEWRGSAGSRALAIVFAALAIASIFLLISLRNWSVIGLVIAMVIAGALTYWSIEVNERGIEARAVLGWPRVRVTRDEIASASVVDVHPLREWAGWGLRFNGKGDTGIVLRSGEGLSVKKKNGRRTVITASGSKEAVEALTRVLSK
ncbi:MAG: hypothetical protein WBQ44_10485 [Rhodococcus sp. (in: high G+C Gram-positive bacteria)]